MVRASAAGGGGRRASVLASLWRRPRRRAGRRPLRRIRAGQRDAGALWIHRRQRLRAGAKTAREGGLLMSHEFTVGDHVTWNSEAGHVSGKIAKVHVKDFAWHGHTRHCSVDDPKYEIKRDKNNTK